MTPDLPAVETAIVEMTNIFRRSQRLTELRRNRLLDQAARRYASFLAKSGRFSHEADGRSHGDRIASTGYKYCQASENLALHMDSRGFQARALARAAIEGWKNSPGHRKNLVAPYVTEIGVGVAKATGIHKYLSVQLFGRPSAFQFRFKVMNGTPATITYRYEGRSTKLAASVVVTHTVCRPGELSFPKAVGAGQQQRGGWSSGYITRAGDLYRAVPRRGGGFKIIHQPQTR